MPIVPTFVSKGYDFAVYTCQLNAKLDAIMQFLQLGGFSSWTCNLNLANPWALIALVAKKNLIVADRTFLAIIWVELLGVVFLTVVLVDGMLLFADATDNIFHRYSPRIAVCSKTI